MKLIEEFYSFMAASYGRDWERYLSDEQVTALKNAFVGGAVIALGDISKATNHRDLVDRMASMHEELGHYLRHDVSRQIADRMAKHG